MTALPREALSFAAFERLAQTSQRVVVHRTYDADERTPLGVGAALTASNVFVLESGEGGERWGRYTYVGEGGSLHVQQSASEARLYRGDTLERSTLAPLALLRGLVGEEPAAHGDGVPPFTGGLVGYLGYPAVHWFEPRVPQRHGPDPAFPDAEWMQVESLAAFDHVSRRLTLLTNVEPAAHPSLRAAYAAAEATLDGLDAKSRLPPPPETPLPAVTGLLATWSRSDFLDAVARVKEYLRAGDCMQVVLSRRLVGRYEGDPFALFRRLRQNAKAPFLFYVRFGDRVVTGASPELLVRVRDETVTVRPIAGTRRRGATPAEDEALEHELRGDPKERAEHVMLVDLGRNDVGRVAAFGSVRIDEREVVERFSHVMHLVSQVSGELRAGHDSFDAIAAAFPAGTVSGAPKIRAMQIIDALEPVSRGPYAGAVGTLGFGGAVDLAIHLRSVALAGTELRLQAGAGLVHDSQPEAEFEETSHKLRGVLTALGLEEPSPEVSARIP